MTYREELASLPLHDRIAAVMDAFGRGQEAFADEVGAKRETVSRWVNRHSRPDRESRGRLAAVASRVYAEEIPPDLFREYVTARQTGETSLIAAAHSIETKLAYLAELLVEQRQLVATMSDVAATLSRVALALEAAQASSRPDPGAP